MSSSTNQKMYVLFYSEHCQFCSEVLKELKNSRLLDTIHLFSVDRKTPPRCITNVPTLYVSKKQSYIGGDIYNWIHIVTNVYAPNPSGQRHATKNRAAIPKEVSSLDDNASFSSGYTFLTEDSENMEFIEHKFTLLNKKQDKIKTIQTDAENKKCTSKDYEEYLKKRSQDMVRLQNNSQ